ncbi:MAG: conjugal transfer protein, partial [Porphyromonas somerae]|nr:conjugal transfer protein [Porphyromonas somerae]
MKRKKLMLALLLIAGTTIGAYAQGNGMAGINEAT